MEKIQNSYFGKFYFHQEVSCPLECHERTLGTYFNVFTHWNTVGNLEMR